MFLKLYRFCLSQYHRYRDIISYLFWGVMTTVVNYAAYFVCTLWLHINYLISNVIAWVVAVIFAFVVNKVFVFRSLDWSSKVVFREAWQFTAARVFSGVLETGGLKVFVDWLHFNDAIVKIVAGFVVVVTNYALSKLVIFRKRRQYDRVINPPVRAAAACTADTSVSAGAAVKPAKNRPGKKGYSDRRVGRNLKSRRRGGIRH
ncbi:MAG: GtrA family protein [Desulfovibrio sp.]